MEDIMETLAPLDARLFNYLQTRPNQVCTFEELFKAVWNDINTPKQTLEAAIHRLRKKIAVVEESNWEYIQNVRGKGYQYIPKPE